MLFTLLNLNNKSLINSLTKTFVCVGVCQEGIKMIIKYCAYHKYCAHKYDYTNVCEYVFVYVSARASGQVGLDAALCVSEWMCAR